MLCELHVQLTCCGILIQSCNFMLLHCAQGLFIAFAVYAFRNATIMYSESRLCVVVTCIRGGADKSLAL
jgi:hypothetical protein